MRILDTEEACELLRVTRKTLWKLAEGGVIPGRKMGGMWRFREDLLLEYLAGPTREKAESVAVAG